MGRAQCTAMQFGVISTVRDGALMDQSVFGIDNVKSLENIDEAGLPHWLTKSTSSIPSEINITILFCNKTTSDLVREQKIYPTLNYTHC